MFGIKPNESHVYGWASEHKNKNNRWVICSLISQCNTLFNVQNCLSQQAQLCVCIRFVELLWWGNGRFIRYTTLEPDWMTESPFEFLGPFCLVIISRITFLRLLRLIAQFSFNPSLGRACFWLASGCRVCHSRLLNCIRTFLLQKMESALDARLIYFKISLLIAGDLWWTFIELLLLPRVIWVLPLLVSRSISFRPSFSKLSEPIFGFVFVSTTH